MLRRVAACALVAALAFPAGASALSPLKRADMKTIRRDARAKAHVFAEQYGAKTFAVTCAKRTPYSARCRIRLRDVRAGSYDCSITLVYVVTRQHAIQGDLGRDGCA